MTFRKTILALLLSAAGGTAAGATVLPPYAGAWDCGVATFTFTRNTYDSGDGPMTAQKVEVGDGGYHFTFADGYGFWVSGITGTSMEWLSDESGDSFTCTRVTQ